MQALSWSKAPLPSAIRCSGHSEIEVIQDLLSSVTEHRENFVLISGFNLLCSIKVCWKHAPTCNESRVTNYFSRIQSVINRHTPVMSFNCCLHHYHQIES